MRDDDVFVTWVGAFEDMPYYYCAPAFPPYGTSTSVVDVIEEELEDVLKEDTLQIHPVQTLPQDTNCDPTIRIDRKSQEVRDFDFFPSNTDFVLMVLTDGVYMVEVDNRAWQNVQPVIQGQDLHMYIENGNIFVLDGEVIYQVQVQST